ncbi:hypothetical protein HY624_03090 [Candidatus Uhrbacteria bacterium]|nr:hypothetical protein [Candidatus Uhrbacteria bacterium]
MKRNRYSFAIVLTFTSLVAFAILTFFSCSREQAPASQAQAGKSPIEGMVSTEPAHSDASHRDPAREVKEAFTKFNDALRAMGDAQTREMEQSRNAMDLADSFAITFNALMPAVEQDFAALNALQKEGACTSDRFAALHVYGEQITNGWREFRDEVDRDTAALFDEAVVPVFTSSVFVPEQLPWGGPDDTLEHEAEKMLVNFFADREMLIETIRNYEQQRNRRVQELMGKGIYRPR